MAVALSHLPPQPQAAQPHDAPLCEGCQAPLAPEWAHCPACGETRAGGRLTVGGLLREFFARVFQLERGFLRTFVDLMRAPGRTARAYVGGVRRAYVAPLPYFFVATAFAVLVYAWFQADLVRAALQAQMDAQFAPSSPGSASVPTEDRVRYMEVSLALVEPTYAYTILLTCALVALIYRGLYRRRGFNFAEIGVLALYTSAQYIFISAVGGLALLPLLGMTGSTLATFAAWGLYLGLATATFFGTGRMRGLASAALALGVAFVLVFVGQGIAVWVYVTLT